MAQSVKINGVTYADVPSVEIPKSTSGTAVFYDTSGADAVAGNILTGKIAFGSSGSITGNMANNGSTSGEISTKSGTVTIPAGYTSGGTVSIASASVSDCVSGNILTGKSILGVSGGLNVPSVSQNSSTKVLSIS